MANREGFVAGLGVKYAGVTLTSGSSFGGGSLTWLPGMISFQPAWVTATSYTAASDNAIGSEVTASSTTFACLTAGGSTSTVNPATGTGGGTTAGTVYGPLSDGYTWLCCGNATADIAGLAAASQDVSQIILDNRPSAGAGDTFIEVSTSLVLSASGAAGSYVTVSLQYLNQDGTTYGDGLGSGTNLSSPSYSQANIYYPAGKSSPIVGNVMLPLLPLKFRLCIGSAAGGTLTAPSSSPYHFVSFRTGMFGLNQ
jgi:hypothetical protein